MGWEILAITAAILYGIVQIIFRHIMKKGNNIAVSFGFQVISAIIFLPFVFLFLEPLPAGYLPWIIVLAASFLWVIDNLVGFEAWKHIDVSLRAPISKVSILFVFLLSVLVLDESVTLQKIGGIALVFIGIIALTWEGKLFRGLSSKGVRLTILAELIYSILVIIDRFALNYFPTLMYSFLVYFLPALMMMPLAIRNKSHVKNLFLKNKIALFSVALLGAIGYYLQLTAYKMTEVSNVIPVIELSVLVSVFGGFLIYKERNLGKRLVGAIFMLIGGILILKPGLF